VGEQYFPQVQEIHDTLFARYGFRNLGNKSDPFDELVFIILSSKTPPARYHQAYADLKLHFPHSSDLSKASVDEVSKVIRFAGLERKKAAQIIQASQQLESRFGDVTLLPMRDMSNEEAERLLTSLPGIGIKSARCILMYSLEREVFPADNHCLRIAKRLQWIDAQSFSKGTANKLQAGIPPYLRKDIHIGMVFLGREYCLPKNPRCHSCPLLDFCPTGLINVS